MVFRLFAGLFAILLIAYTNTVEARCFPICCLVFEGNRHTRTEILQRELLFKPGDTICLPKDSGKIVQSRFQLINLRLFNTVEIIPILLPNQKWEITIRVREKWYVWPRPILYQPDRNFNVWIQQRDLSRLNFGTHIKAVNLSGRNDVLRTIIQWGYTRKAHINYQVPWFDKKGKWGLEMEGAYQQAKEIWLDTRNDKLLFFRTDHEILFSQSNLKIGGKFRPKQLWRYSFFVDWENFHVADTIRHPMLNPEYLYQNRNSQNAFGFSSSFLFDTRDVRDYPLRGNYLKAEIQLKTIDKQVWTFFNIWAQSFYAYKNRLFTLAALRGRWILPETLPYIWRRAIGYQDFIRGYEYYVIDGSNFITAKTSLKLALNKEKQFQIPFFPFKNYQYVPTRVFATVFAEAGKVENNNFRAINNLPGKLLSSGGVGLDFVFYYDKVLSVNYSWNGLGEQGIYLHFKNPL